MINASSCGGIELGGGFDIRAGSIVAGRIVQLVEMGAKFVFYSRESEVLLVIVFLSTNGLLLKERLRVGSNDCEFVLEMI